MSAVRGGDRIEISGPPRNLKAEIHLEAGGARVMPVELSLPDGPSIQRAYVRARGPGTGEIRLKLPDETPPGTYSGEARVGDSSLQIALNVVPVLRVRVRPGLTPVSAEPGGRAEFTITVSNTGNVPVDVPKQAVLDLDDDRGQDRALGRALRADLGEGERRVDRFFEELRDSHGGEGRVTVLKGAGSLGPGESRELRCQLEVPMTTEPDRSYSGGWGFGNSGHALVVEVLKPAPGTPRTRGRKSR